ncbi:MAG: cytochrome P450 [Alphaproteobacteria bacterium]
MKATTDLDITTPTAFADFEGIHAKFRQLRAETPVAWVAPEKYRPFWAVTKHADIQEVEGQPDKFLNDPRLTLMEIEQEEQILAMTGSNHILRSLVDMDNPDHSKYRLLTQAWFMPKNVKTREAAVRKLAKEAVDRMAAMGGECDFVNDVAVWYPLRVIMSILGVEPKDEPLMLKLTQELFGATDPDQGRSDQTIDTNVLLDFFTFFNALTQDRRANPRDDDVASVIANAKIDGELLPDLEAMSYYIIIATAGHDTTSSSTAGGMLNMIQNPDQLQKLRDNPDLMGNAIEEMIRHETPVKHFFRTAKEDYELRGQQIKAGDSLAMFYHSGNRDEDVFEDPDAFQVDREIAKNIAFGHGPHLCLGMHLARMEMRYLFEELLPRLKSIELAGEPTRVAANFVSGLKTLPIKYEMI